MRKMADRSCYQIMLLIIKYDRNRLQRGDELLICLHLFPGYFCRRSQDIISVFYQMCFGVCKSALFRSSHWVSADETFLHAK